MRRATHQCGACMTRRCLAARLWATTAAPRGGGPPGGPDCGAATITSDDERSVPLRRRRDGRAMKVNPLRPRSVPDDGIVVYPIERMGNQLFQWAAGLAQARRLGCPCYVALGFYTHAPKRRYGLSFALETIDHGMIVADDRAVHRPIFYALEPMGKIQTVLGRVARDPRIMDKLFVERSF